MKVEKRDGSEERRILTGMIVNPIVLGKITEKWEKELFNSRWANLVGDWCVTYYGQYGTCPSAAIQSVFETWAGPSKDEATIKMVETFLSSLSGCYEDEKEEINPDHLVDVASAHFNRNKIRKLSDRIQGHLDINQLQEAIDAVHTFGKIEIGIGAGIDVINDSNVLKEIFDKNEEDLFTYPGPLGEFFHGQLQRENFVAFTGPEKRGKTFWLIDIAYRALLARRRVAFFAVGDMTQKQMMRRFAARTSRRPFSADTIRIPRKMKKKRKEDIARVKYEERVFDSRMTYKEAKEGMKWVQHKTRSKRTLLKLSCHPNNTINVKGIMSILQGWEVDGWVPDVIVIDYADILAPSSQVKETRDQINETWKQLRSLSQTYHCLVVTATQANAASYTANRLSMGNFSEDKRKNSHVTAMIGINQKSEEKEAQIARLNWLVMREGDFNPSRCVHVANCLAISNPAILSCF